MDLMKTSNPALSNAAWDVGSEHTGYGETMTISGTVNKTGILIICVALTAIWTWNDFLKNGPAAVGALMAVGGIGGFVAAMVTVFKKQWAPVTAPVYALLEGLLLGSLSAMMELRFPGIAIEAVALTFGTCICLLLAYRAGLIQPTQRLTAGIVAATGGIAVVYFASMILGFFHVQIPGIFGNGPIGIVFSLVVTAVAALNLILDFSFIENSARGGAPKYMEWYSAFSLMVTLIWLYMEIIRLLSKLRSRN